MRRRADDFYEGLTVTVPVISPDFSVKAGDSTMRRRALLLSLAIAATGSGILWAQAPEDVPVYPGKSWASRKPAELGLDSGKLRRMSDLTGGFGCVVRRGYMVYTWGDASKRKDVASAVKPFYTHFLLRAVEQGMIKSIDEPVSDIEPRLKPLNKALGYKDRRITWRHLANQISCYGVQEPPGRAFDYSDYNMALFFDSLFLKVYGTTWEKVDAEVLHPGLTDLLQCEDEPTFMAFGTGNRPGRLAISPRDFARFGLLYLRGGRWKGRQLISRKSVRLAVRSPLPISIPRTSGRKSEMIPHQRSIGGGSNQCDHNGSYSFAWWVNGIGRDGKRNWPDVGSDVFGCFGHGDIRAMVVMPSLDLIVCWNDSRIKGWKMVNQALRLLKEAAGSWAFGSELRYFVEPVGQYDAVFERQDGWTGGDAAYTVAIAQGVTLWLFGDSWIGPVVQGRHKQATLVNNTVAIQQGNAPSADRVRFYWGKGDRGRPEAFIKPADGLGWFWIFDGVMDGGRLYLFLMQMDKTGEKGIWGFKHVGTWLGEVENPLSAPNQWRITQHKVPFGRYSKRADMFFGSAVMADGDYIYIYGADEQPGKGFGGRSMIAARVRQGRIKDFDQWRFYDGGAWVEDVAGAARLFAGMATEYSVSYQPRIKRYIAVYTENGLSAKILMRTAETPVGPWSRAETIYECPEAGWDKSYFCYAAKAHPEISGEDELLVTYLCNSTDFAKMVNDTRIYRPRFLRIRFDAPRKQARIGCTY